MSTATATATPTPSPTPAGKGEPKELVAKMVKQVATLATLPEVTASIITTVEDPKSTAQALHKIVAHDPALVTRILKVVNSAFYGLPGQIASIERAIVLLGLNAVKNIAVAASLGQMFRGVQLCEGFTAKDLWQHCIAVAVTARELAKSLKIPVVDEAFLAGMIHDIGMLVALQTAPDQLRTVCERVRTGAATDFCATEREIMGVDHQMLGRALAEQWKFPNTCQLVAGFHHQPEGLSENNHILVWVVNAADVLCAQGQKGFNLTALHQKLDEKGLAYVKIDTALIERTRNNLDELVKNASPLL
jgi:putative nucleotidyltransferase with HDIG domain